jgi:hypothetical protein
MIIRYLKEEYVGESRDVQKIINKVTPFVCETDIAHIKRVLTQGCPSCLVFDEARENKLFLIRKGNQHTVIGHGIGGKVIRAKMARLAESQLLE